MQNTQSFLDIIVQLDKLKASIEAISANSQISQLEIDLSLEKLRQMYDSIVSIKQNGSTFKATTPTPTSNVQAPKVAQPEEKTQAVIETQKEEILTEPIIEEEPIVEITEPTPEIVAKPKEEPIVEKPIDKKDVVEDIPVEDPVEEYIEEEEVELIIEKPEPVEEKPESIEPANEIPEVELEEKKEVQPDPEPIAKPTPTPKPEVKPEPVKEAKPKAKKKPEEPKVEEKPAPVEDIKIKATEQKKETKVKQKPVAQSNIPKENSGKVIGDQLGANKKSLFDQIHGKNHGKDIVSQMKNKPVTNIHKAISINDRIWFMKELFEGNSDIYKQTVDKLNACNDIEEALDIITQNFNWNSEDNVVQKFMSIISRRFILTE